ncbi:CHAT domain-containing protein [Amycolatopsis jiangsuensis]|uniref:CHAT domain-containing protein n=1 Tax=Amycolatopsis jiangsuensis TaxID=1181879 RepID=A0A840IV87_9PSEU|nr:CHAT domain-containing protein [Amycolatopsis jiangsuensis]MBB4684874.1 hypothetical protein [Amycolatopsis jiangsuensis]
MLDTRYAERYLRLRADLAGRGDPDFAALEALVTADPAVRDAIAAFDRQPDSAAARESVLVALGWLGTADPDRARRAAAELDRLWSRSDADAPGDVLGSSADVPAQPPGGCGQQPGPSQASYGEQQELPWGSPPPDRGAAPPSQGSQPPGSGSPSPWQDSPQPEPDTPPPDWGNHFNGSRVPVPGSARGRRRKVRRRRARPREPVVADSFRPSPPQPESRRPAPGGDSRYLVAGLPHRAGLGGEISLLVRVAADPSRWSAAASLARLFVPGGGTEISVFVQPSPGLVPLGAPEQRLKVPQSGESEPVRFAFRTVQPGLHGVRVTAFAGGTFLAELEAQVSVEPNGPAGQPQWSGFALPDDVRARRGEVTLQVRSVGGQTVFQLLSDACLFEPVLAQGTAGDASAAIERAITTLKQLAQGRGPYQGNTARRWMAETGVGLWQAMVPHVLKEQFWQIRDDISAFSIATDFDVVPWELLYPLRPGADAGFLVEQFPVTRRVFGQARNDRLTVTPCTYVVSARAPADAQRELDALSRVLGPGTPVSELDALLDLLSAGHGGGLHFACHTTFTPEDGVSIAMTGGPFVPGLLNSATVRQSLAGYRPLVFLNACRTAGNAPEFSRMTGWAQQFMAAGAGAFIGTLWPVRSESARVFAETFYDVLRGGETLGNALGWARQAAVRDDPDPTWLAYTAYGDPEARAFRPPGG